MFVNLFTHSYYSLLMSSMSIDDIIYFAKKNKQTHVCLTDFNNMYGAIEFYKKAILNNLKPIIGLHTNYNRHDLYLIAKNYYGYKNLVKISSFINIKREFNMNDYLSDIFIIVDNLKDVNWFNKDLEIYTLEENHNNSIAGQPAFFETKDDFIYFKSLVAIKDNLKLNDVKVEKKISSYYMYSEREALIKFSKKAIDNVEHIINNCDLKIIFNNASNNIEFDKSKNSKVLLQSLCVENLIKKFKLKSNIPNNYMLRLRYELDVIDKKKFNDYFLVVQDYVGFAKNNNILVGPGRGSACGSLVAYLLGITTIDPIENNLIFERFLNPERESMPDIDVDFMDSRREEVVDYIFNKYGRDHTCHIITFQRIKAKMAIRDVGRILDMNKTIIESISKLLMDDFSSINQSIKKKLDKYVADYPLLFKIAKKIQNYPRQTGVHAAGIVISSKKMYEIIPIQLSSTGKYATQYSMEYMESLGLIKIDILGLVNLSIISQALNLIYSYKNKNLDLNKIPMNDLKVFNYISQGKTTGIFQLESSGMTNLVKKIKPKSIEDISVCSALYRPGPQKNISLYLSNKLNPEKIEYLNNDLKSILAPTYNVIVYQEQVIKIAEKIAGFNLGVSDSFRRALSKKNEDELIKLKQDFINGGMKNKYSKEILNKIYDYILEFANYGFNHSHALAYSYISYWLAYIAYYFPLEFYTVLLINNGGSTEKINEYLNCALSQGISILPLDINLSSSNFSIVQSKKIILGFNIVKGIGQTISNKIISIRESLNGKKFDNLFSCIKILANNGIGLKTITLLAYSGAFDCFNNQYSRFWIVKNLNSIFENVNNILTTGECITNMKLDNAVPTKEELEQLSKKEQEYTGILLKKVPLIKLKEKYSSQFTNLVSLRSFLDSSVENGYYHIIVKINSITAFKDKNGHPMSFISVEDETLFMNKLPIFWEVYSKYSSNLKEGIFAVLTVKKNKRINNNLLILKIMELS